MAGTYSQIYIQYVFAVKARQNLLQKPWREEVFKYIAGIIKEKTNYYKWNLRPCSRFCGLKTINEYIRFGKRH